jgi:hypothetical protein
MTGDPFDALGLDRRGDLADDEIRAAWRRVAAATHPDRADGGDPPAFAAAAAAYTMLRTRTGRGEALADLLAPAAPARPGVTALGRRIRVGRPLVVALRVLVAVGVSLIAVLAAGWQQPATPAVITGAVTWLLLTARSDLS